ncbi:hypothetical protein A1Q2_05411 [Trichosporon asahii var. asahii CBS 8904]|uniref:Agmatinase n=1 Tax=Trichosporon asahii var. asahii (strain CBS 8904) TaxID=1220162 RepID=K1WFA1_TRIAC|nr:hypothetical protein A1Q2_05411 [Trichosporon asahii var. asahii CBS 8904]
MRFLTLCTLLSSLVFAHSGQETFDQEPWHLTFSGIAGFMRLPFARCLEEPGKAFDLAILGMPFDSSSPQIDCNDVPISPYDPALAIDEMQTAYATLINRPVVNADGYTAQLAKDGREHPRILTLGGDHTIVLPILGALYDVYGPITVLHFDAHLDTWNGHELGGAHSEQHKVVSKAADRQSMNDLLHDEAVGFQVFTTDDIDDMGADGIAAALKKRLGKGPVYLSFDIDTIDPSMAPAIKRIIRALGDLNIVGADIVEVAPAYDTNAELTAMAASDLAQEFMALMIARKPNPAVKGGKLNPGLKAKAKVGTNERKKLLAVENVSGGSL